MNSTLKKIKNIISENCVSIVLNTHRTRPDNQKDSLMLKNLIKEVEERLLNNESKREAKVLIERIKELEATIDHSQNLESLILFVNDNLAEYVRLPIEVENRIIIDNTFATRDLIRALHFESNYYVLVLSQQKVRLIEAFNEKVIEEVKQPFPIENTQFYSTNKAELSNASRQTNLIAEFFNRTDKDLNEVRKENSLPVLICSEKSNYYEYIKVAKQKNSIFDSYLNKNRLDETPQSIVSEAWNIIKKDLIKKNNARKGELQNALSSGKFLSDINDIWKAILEGRVQTLFIEEGLFQAAIIKGNEIQLVSSVEVPDKEIADDIYDEMIEANINYGGDVVFLPKGELRKFQGFGAILRY